jgi:hypothetical protein
MFTGYPAGNALDPYVVFSPAVQWDPPIPANGRMDFIIVLSPDFNRIKRWAVIEMGLEGVHVEYF